MSYIYDALKRAQTENERAATSPRIVGRRAMFLGRRSRWGLWLVSGVIAANLFVLTAVIVRQRPPVAPVSVASEVTSEVRSPVAPVVPVVKDAPVPEPVTPKHTPPVSAPRVPPATVRVPAPIERKIERRPPITAPSPVAPAPPAETVVEPSAPIAAPTVTLQVIVDSEIPAQRMVFIDGRRYREGDAFDSETVLERINADGIVMKRRGQRFVISNPRP
jgi:hypothetical protein